jgi:hypothetical protein
MTETAGIHVDPNPSALVSASFPFTRLFRLTGHIGPALLIMEVKTGYESAARSMDVLFNNAKIGDITPKPFSRGPDLVPISLKFLTSGLPNVNELKVVPKGNQPDDYLIIGNWWIHYHLEF